MPHALLAAAGETHWSLDVLGLLAIPALVLLNGFFVAAEFALVAVRRTRVEEMVSQGVRGASAVNAAIDNLDRSIAATQLGITLASIALGFVAEPALARLIEPAFSSLPEFWIPIAAHSAAVTVAFIFITFLHVIFGELIPKTLALQTPDTTALWVARPMLLFVRLTRPLILIMNGSGNAILRLAGYKPASSETLIHSVEELALLVEDTEEAGLLDPDQAELVQNVFLLTNKEVRDCMIPRDKMATLELSMSPEKVMECVRAGAHTRMPVYDREADEYVGIVNTKDLFYLFSLKGVVVLEDALYMPVYLKEDESVANALRLFKKSHRHMALVRNEAGKVAGLVTLEDVLEEIIGDIEDEHDRPVPKLTRRRLRRLPPKAKKP
jgi:putative hemolysin